MTDVDLPSWMDRDPMGERSLSQGDATAVPHPSPEPPADWPRTESRFAEAVLAAGDAFQEIMGRDTGPSPAIVVREYDQIAADLITRIHAVPAVDHEHVKGIRLIRDRLNKHLAELADFDRSGVTG